MVDAINIALSSLQANTERVRVSANNVANAGTTGALDPATGRAAYTPQDVVAVTDGSGGGVQTRVVDRNPATVAAYSPNDPNANEEGMIAVPNVDLADEAVKFKLAETSYKAALDVIKVAGKMEDELLKTFDEKA